MISDVVVAVGSPLRRRIRNLSVNHAVVGIVVVAKADTVSRFVARCLVAIVSVVVALIDFIGVESHNGRQADISRRRIRWVGALVLTAGRPTQVCVSPADVRS